MKTWREFWDSAGAFGDGPRFDLGLAGALPSGKERDFAFCSVGILAITTNNRDCAFHVICPTVRHQKGC